MIIPAKPPVSFFSSRSPVLDLFQGQLDYADHVRQDSEVVVLFFYAPWCGQSIAARAEIEQAASRLSDQVMCAFHPSSDCRICIREDGPSEKLCQTGSDIQVNSGNLSGAKPVKKESCRDGQGARVRFSSVASGDVCLPRIPGCSTEDSRDPEPRLSHVQFMWLVNSSML